MPHSRTGELDMDEMRVVLASLLPGLARREMLELVKEVRLTLDLTLPRLYLYLTSHYLTSSYPTLP